MTEYIEPDSIPNFCVESFSTFNQLRKDGQLCDVSINVDGRILKAHKVVLSARSPYFLKQFNLPMLDADKKQISFPDISYETMEKVIDFIYTSKISISAETVQYIYLAANYLLIDILTNLCKKYILKQIDDVNCFEIRDLLVMTDGDQEVIGKANGYINANFQRICENDSFLCLEVNSVVEFLSRSEVIVLSEDDVYRSAMRWLEVTEDRKQYTQQILNCIRFSCLSDACKVEYMKNNPILNDTHIDTPRRLRTFLLALNYGTSESMFFYNSCTKQWTTPFEMKDYECNHLVSNDEHFFLVRQRSDDGQDILQYNIKKREWFELPALQHVPGTKIKNLLCIGKKLYAFRSDNLRDSIDRLSIKIDVFDIETRTWDDGPVIKHDFLRTFVALDKFIYDLGGTYGRKWNIETQTWHEIALMKSKRLGFGVTIYQGKIYSAGGFATSSTSIKNKRIDQVVEVYDPIKNEYKEVAPMVTGMSNITLVATTDGIFAIGRTLENNSIIQFYDAAEDQWTIEGNCPDGLECKWLTACAVPNLYFPP